MSVARPGPRPPTLAAAATGQPQDCGASPGGSGWLDACRSPGAADAALIGDTSAGGGLGRGAAMGLGSGGGMSTVPSPQPLMLQQLPGRVHFLPTTPDTGGAPRCRAPLSPMSRQPSFASPNPLLPLSRCGPGHDDAISIANYSENQDPNLQTVPGVGRTFGQWSDDRASSMSSRTKRRFEDALEDAKAVIEARLREEYEQSYAKKLSNEVEMQRQPKGKRRQRKRRRRWPSTSTTPGSAS